jgi:hypothetical protein
MDPFDDHPVAIEGLVFEVVDRVRTSAAMMAFSVIPICPVFGWTFGRGRGAGPGPAVLPVGAAHAMAVRLAVAPVAAGVAVHSSEDLAVEKAEPLAPALTRAVAASAAPT